MPNPDYLALSCSKRKTTTKKTVSLSQATGNECKNPKLNVPETFNPNPHGMFWTKTIYDLASSEPYSLSSLNIKI